MAVKRVHDGLYQLRGATAQGQDSGEIRLVSDFKTAFDMLLSGRWRKLSWVDELGDRIRLVKDGNTIHGYQYHSSRQG